MSIKEVDLARLSKLASKQIEQITCLECCKHYNAPETAACGHTLCHKCWSGRRTCPSCAKPVEKKSLKMNIRVQNLTDTTNTFRLSLEKLFNIRMDELLLDPDSDPTKNVKEWLASSQNHFSAPPQSSDLSSQDLLLNVNPLEISSSEIQIHNNSKKTTSPKKIVHVPAPQEDWDKIETMPDTENIVKGKENVIGPMDIEPFYYDDNEYNVNKPRRSFRNKDVVKQPIQDSSGETDKKSKHNWNNVKKMRKEFSKLNKKNRNKLNVSIEMCKKTQSSIKPTVIPPKIDSPQMYDIDENTPDLNNIQADTNKNNKSDNGNTLHSNNSENDNINSNVSSTIKQAITINQENNEDSMNTKHLNLTHPVTVNKNNIENISQSRMPFYKKGLIYPMCNEKNPTKTLNIESNPQNANDDIEITIKIGTTITNIVIKKKNEVDVRVNTDREVQTTQTPANVNLTNSAVISKDLEDHSIHINVANNTNPVNPEPHTNFPTEQPRQITTSIKSTKSGKKNTDSADTGTAQFEITESVEKELSNIMECEEVSVVQNKDTGNSSKSKITPKTATNIGTDDLEYLNDYDIFDSEVVKDTNVNLLKNTKQCPSEILVPTARSRNKTQKNKRNRSEDDNETPHFKKAKLQKKEAIVEINESANEDIPKETPENIDSEPINYDSFMGKVFKNIDADIEEIKKTQDSNKIQKNTPTEIITQNREIISGTVVDINTQKFNELCNKKNTDCLFSECDDKENENDPLVPIPEKAPNISQSSIEDFLTPVVCAKLETANNIITQGKDVEMSDEDDSDKSVVEETPQKNTSFQKIKQKSTATNKESNESVVGPSSKQSSNSDNIKSVVNITDTTIGTKCNKDITVVDVIARNTLETPLTINKFVDQIKHKSTPVARKSLNFDNENDDPEQTLCPTAEQIAKTTQEKEFLMKAFENTPKSTTPVASSRTQSANKLCVAGSCLSATETIKLKLLCSRYKFTYVDKFCNELTHLVVGVDEENKAQRSVKYMCALAASKWIVSYTWVETCLQKATIVNESPHEALDSTGAAGPRRAREARDKLFKGIKFFCMEPFSVLDVNTLKDMLLAAGGEVVTEAKGVKITEKTSGPAILLAEPENTQEDRFIYLAMELNIVPVNYEWVLNCLGGYALESIHELLLCPAAILPKAIENWPQQLITQEDE